MPPPQKCDRTRARRYAVGASTVVMACNYSGFRDASLDADFGWVQYDWSTDKDEWVQEKPMDCEAAASEQATLLKAAAPNAVAGLYRSGPKALPWFPEVRAKLDDPAYENWFVKFQDLQKTNVPVCTGSKCSALYHDQTQVPQRKETNGDDYDNGECDEECDCGAQPCGNYVFDFRNESLREWYVQTLYPAAAPKPPADYPRRGRSTAATRLGGRPPRGPRGVVAAAAPPRPASAGDLKVEAATPPPRNPHPAGTWTRSPRRPTRGSTSTTGSTATIKETST